jgi:hypothetical protein
LRDSVDILLRQSRVVDQTGLMANEEFMQTLMHAAAYRFGLAIKITIEAIGGAIFLMGNGPWSWNFSPVHISTGRTMMMT